MEHPFLYIYLLQIERIFIHYKRRKVLIKFFGIINRYVLIFSILIFCIGCNVKSSNISEVNLSNKSNKILITKSELFNIENIVDSKNFGWPRSVKTTEGIMIINEPPERVHSLSLGHTEILAGIMDFNKILAVYSFFYDSTISNISEIASTSVEIGYDPEEVVGLNPDMVIASKYTDPQTVAILKEAGIPVLRAELDSSAQGNIPNILLMGYVLGREDAAISLVNEIEDRLDFLSKKIPNTNQKRVLSITKWATIFAAGSNSTEGGIIEQAGAINAAAEVVINQHKEISIESIAEINPDVILLPQPRKGAEEFQKELLNHPVLLEVPAIKNQKIFHVHPPYYTTLSHWNVRGIENLCKLLYPDVFSSIIFEDFEN